MSSAVAHALPPSILALFAPRVPIDYKAPLPKRKQLNYTAIAHLVGEFEDPSETPPATKIESLEEIKERKIKEHEEKAKENLDASVAEYDPASDGKIKGDPYKTLFVSRIRCPGQSVLSGSVCAVCSLRSARSTCHHFPEVARTLSSRAPRTFAATRLLRPS